MQLPPQPCTRRLLRAAPRPRRPCGRMGVLPPPGMLHGASAAFPGRCTADTRPSPGREGGGREEGGREGASTAVSGPSWLCSDPGWRGPSLLGTASVPQALSPVRPPGFTPLPSTPTPGHDRLALDRQGQGFYLGPTTGAWETKPQISATEGCVQPPAEGPASLQGEGAVGSRMGNTF